MANYFSQRRPRVSQSVNVNSQLGTPKQFFVIFLEFSLVAKFKAPFIEIISHFESDIRSCRCNNSSIKQASCLIGGLDPPDPPPPLDPPLYQWARPPVFPICKQPLYRPTSHTTSFSTLQLRLYSAVLNASGEQQKYKKVNQYETRLASKKSLPKARTNYGKFNSSSAKLWNSVPEDLKSEGRSCFKKPLLEECMALNTDGSLVYFIYSQLSTQYSPCLVFFFISGYVCISLFNTNVNIYLMRLAFGISKWLCSLSCLFKHVVYFPFFPEH